MSDPAPPKEEKKTKPKKDKKKAGEGRQFLIKDSSLRPQGVSLLLLWSCVVFDPPVCIYIYIYIYILAWTHCCSWYFSFFSFLSLMGPSFVHFMMDFFFYFCAPTDQQLIILRDSKSF